jgi:hypothetical protein
MTFVLDTKGFQYGASRVQNAVFIPEGKEIRSVLLQSENFGEW